MLPIPYGNHILGPVAPVQGSVLDRLGDVRDRDAFALGQIGYRTSHLKDSVVSTGRESLLLHGSLEETFGFWREVAVGADLLRVHLRIGKNRRAFG